MQNVMANPYYYNPEDDNFAEDVEMEFNSEIFHIDSNDPFGSGNAKYEALMERLIDPNEKDLMLNFYSASAVSKSWQKDGTMLVHVEYLKLKRKERTAITSEVDGRVESITRTEAGGFTIVVSGEPYSVPPGMDLQVTVGNDVEMGQLLAGSHTPKADDRAY